MPAVLITKLGPYNEEKNPELICEVCKCNRKEEELNFNRLIFEHPDDPQYIVDIALNLCVYCEENFVGNATMNRVHDTFNPSN